MRSYMQTCHFILLNNYCLFINGTKLVKISGLFRFTCIVYGIQCTELNYILLGEHLMCLYFCSQKRKMAESISMAQPSLFFPHIDLYEYATIVLEKCIIKRNVFMEKCIFAISIFLEKCRSNAAQKDPIIYR